MGGPPSSVVGNVRRGRSTLPNPGGAIDRHDPPRSVRYPAGVISRRAFLGTGLAAGAVAGVLVVADATHRLDDLARAVGVEPHPEPDPADDRVVADARTQMATLLALVGATVARHPGLELGDLEALGREQLAALGGGSRLPEAPVVDDDPSAAATTLSAAYDAASAARADDAGAAVSPDLVRVLASMSAGLAQCARTAEDAA
jgi:hypothetical protein